MLKILDHACIDYIESSLVRGLTNVFDDPAGFSLWVNDASESELSSIYKEWCSGEFDLCRCDQILLINKCKDKGVKLFALK